MEVKGNYLVMTQSLAQKSFLYAGIDAITNGIYCENYEGNNLLNTPAELELILNKIDFWVKKAEDQFSMSQVNIFSEGDEISFLSRISFNLRNKLVLFEKLFEHWKSIGSQGKNALIESAEMIQKTVFDPMQNLFPIPTFYYTVSQEQKAMVDAAVTYGVEEYVQKIESNNSKEKVMHGYFLMTQCIARIACICAQTEILFDDSRRRSYEKTDVEKNGYQKFETVEANSINILTQSYTLFTELKDCYTNLIPIDLIDNILRRMMEIQKARLHALKSSWIPASSIGREVIKTAEALFPIPLSHLTISSELSGFAINSIKKDWEKYLYYLQKDWDEYLTYH